MFTDTTSSAPMAGSASAVDHCKARPPMVSVLGPSVYRLAMRRACAIVKALSEAEVQKMAQTILDSTDGSLNLTGKVEERLADGDVDLKRSGLAEFSVDNYGLDLAQKQRVIDETRRLAADIVRARTAGIRFLDMVTHPRKPVSVIPRQVVVETVLTPGEAEMLRQEFLTRVNHHGVFDQFMNSLEPCHWKNMHLVTKPFQGTASTAVARQTQHLIAARRIFADFLSEVSPA